MHNKVVTQVLKDRDIVMLHVVKTKQKNYTGKTDHAIAIKV
jgi:hypothetical protein